jgi:two-component system, NtrC family, response regulator GlrR
MAVNGLVGSSRPHLAILEKLAKFAATDAEILLVGDTGTGKELYARYAHEKSARAKAPFIPVNCGAIPETLFENELFGHVQGAFTGAKPVSDGLAVAAEGGTLFLDEVDALSAHNQIKLLRFIQEKEYRRLGECRLRRANVRFIAATNADLRAQVDEGRFRQDLYFRLRVVPIEVPPLKARPEDVASLAAAYVAHFADRYGLPEIVFCPSALARMQAYGWPGNVRELENCVHYLTCLQLERPVQAEDLPLLSAPEPARQAMPRANGTDVALSFQAAKQQLIEMFERNYLEEALRRSNGNIAEAARASGKARRAFFELMRKHGVAAMAVARSDVPLK